MAKKGNNYVNNKYDKIVYKTNTIKSFACEFLKIAEAKYIKIFTFAL